MHDANPGTAGTAPDVGQGTTDALRALVDVLGREQKLLERLAYAATQAALLLAAAEERHLVAAADEVVDAARDVGTIEVARALLVMEVAAAWGLDDDQPTLRTIRDAAPEVFRPVLEARRADLQRLSEEIAGISSSGTELAAAGGSRIAAALVGLDSGPAGGYTSEGAPSPAVAAGFASDRSA